MEGSTGSQRTSRTRPGPRFRKRQQGFPMEHGGRQPGWVTVWSRHDTASFRSPASGAGGWRWVALCIGCFANSYLRPTAVVATAKAALWKVDCNGFPGRDGLTSRLTPASRKRKWNRSNTGCSPIDELARPAADQLRVCVEIDRATTTAAGLECVPNGIPILPTVSRFPIAQIDASP